MATIATPKFFTAGFMSAFLNTRRELKRSIFSFASSTNCPQKRSNGDIQTESVGNNFILRRKRLVMKLEDGF